MDELLLKYVESTMRMLLHGSSQFLELDFNSGLA